MGLRFLSGNKVPQPYGHALFFDPEGREGGEKGNKPLNNSITGKSRLPLPKIIIPRPQDNGGKYCPLR